MRISPSLAHRLQDDCTEGIGALEIGLDAHTERDCKERIRQAKEVLLRISQRVAIHTDRSLAQEKNDSSK
jgi:hypothetical protein